MPGLGEPALRHAHRDRARRSTTASSSRCRRCSRRTSSSASAGSRVARSASWPTSRCSSPAPSTSTRRRRRRGSCAPATRSTSRCSPSSTSPASCPAPSQEWDGIIRRGAKLIYAYAEATVPEGHRHHPQGLRRRLRRHGLQAPRRRHQPRLADRADRGHGRPGRGQHPLPQGARRRPARPRGGAQAELVAEYEDTLANPYIAAERGYVDSVIPPSHTRVLRHPGAAGAAHQARRPCRRRSTGTSRSDDRPTRPASRRRSRSGPCCGSCAASRPPEELAALVAVLTAPAAGATGGEQPTAARSAWHDPARLVRRPLHAGPDGWRSSARPG